MNLVTPCGLAALALLVVDSPSHVYEAGRTIRVTTKLSLVSETVDLEMVIDGEQRDGRGGNQPSEVTLAVVHTDETVEAEEGLPARVVRTFERLDHEVLQAMGDEEVQEERDSPFEDLVLELGFDEDGELELDVVEGSEPESELLEGHVMQLSVDGLLEGAEFEADATWSLGDEAIRRALTLDLELLLFPAPEPDQDASGGGGRGGGWRGGRGPQSLTEAEAEWEGEARIEDLEGDYEGMEVAVIELEFNSEGDLPERQGGGGGGGAGGQRSLALPALLRDNTFNYELTGTLYFSMEQQRPVALEVEGTITRRTERISSRGGREVEVRSTRVGEWNQTTLFEIVEDDQ